MFLRLATVARRVAPVEQQVRFKSKYTSRTAGKFLPLHSKHAKKGWYKGNGCRSTGTLDSKAHFHIDRERLIKIIVPDLTNFKLKPYVAKTVEQEKFPMPLAQLTEGQAKSATA